MNNTSSNSDTPTCGKNDVPAPVSVGSALEIIPTRAEMPEFLPEGYSLREEGVFQMQEVKGGDLLPVRICSPLVVKGLCTKGAAGWGRLVEVQDPNGDWHEVILEARDVSKRSVTSLHPLFDRGLELGPVEKAAQRVVELLATWRPTTTYRRVDRLGWTDENCTAFSLGDGRVVGGGHVVTEGMSTDIATSMHEEGTLEGWRTEVAKNCIGNPLMILALSHAFSGPLLSMMGKMGGGFHLRGASSRGKSTIQFVAGSVWGAPSFLQSWNSTGNGLEGIAAACNNTFLNLDELHMADPGTIGDVIYMLANGQGKLRAKSNGRNQATQRWTVPVLSSGELSLEEHMASSGRKMYAGQDVRLIDLTADGRQHGAFDCLHGASDGRDFANRMQHSVRTNFGVAGPAFVERLTRSPTVSSVARRFVGNVVRIWQAELDGISDGQVQRVMERFVIAAISGELATRFGLTGWSKGWATSAAFEIFNEWLDARAGATREEVDEAAKRTASYLSKNMARFACLNADEADPIDGWFDEDWVYMRPECWGEIHPGEDLREMSRLLDLAGLLRTQAGEGLQYRMGRKVRGRPRVYAIKKREILGHLEN